MLWNKKFNYISVVLDKQKVELHDFVNRDVIGYFIDKGHIGINILFIRNNKLIGSHNDILTIKMDSLTELNDYILNFYTRHEIPKEILVGESFDSNLLSEVIETSFVIPEKGIKKKLVDMAVLNSKIYLEQEITTFERVEYRTNIANEELKELLHMNNLKRIDLFDNSNLFGSYAVSGMVVYKEGLPSKKDYRKYKVYVDKNDDYNTMKEVIYRRYQRALVEHTELPDLIIADGGINQINAVKDTLSELNLHIKVAGLRKNDKHMTNDLIDGDDYSVVTIDKDSNVFHYLTRMQDEVHRFAISYHRQIRSKGSISSVLDEVEGIGSVRKKELIKKYGSVSKIKEASVEELSSIIPENVAVELKKYLEARDSK